MEQSQNHSHDEGSCCNCKAGDSTRQTLSELDFERGIWYAAQSNDLARVRKLLDRGNSPNAEDAAGYRALHYAARNGHEDVCRELLRRGARVDAPTRSGRATALHRAAAQKRASVVQLLLDAGADANLQDADGYTALHRAILADCDSVIRLLAPRTRLDLKDKNGCTPTQLARDRAKEHLLS